jgi:hypothetical protein
MILGLDRMAVKNSTFPLTKFAIFSSVNFVSFFSRRSSKPLFRTTDA